MQNQRIDSERDIVHRNGANNFNILSVSTSTSTAHSYTPKAVRGYATLHRARCVSGIAITNPERQLLAASLCAL
jgi:hypothetical protein